MDQILKSGSSGYISGLVGGSLDILIGPPHSELKASLRYGQNVEK
jgi:hypothetical protein